MEYADVEMPRDMPLLRPLPVTDHEHDHFPIPRRAGGTSTVPACIDCHDLKDRYPIFSWPMSVVGSMLQGCKPQPAMELLVALADSMPERYRGRFAGDPLPARLRALPDWSTEELVESVLAATTTEARLYLAHGLSVSWDWRAVEMDVQPGDPRSGSDASR